MTLDPSKGYRALRDGRHSLNDAEYFVTFCTFQRESGLTSDAIGTTIIREIQQMETDAAWSMRCAIIMPDHVHLFFRLGRKLSLGKAVARLKAKSSPQLRKHGVAWQAGYFEHQLRPKEDILPLFLYIHLNPYKAGLISTNETWPWFICSPEDKMWFSTYLDEDLPEPAWLDALP